ncbi:hypothetical protein EQH57_0333 [Dictyocoela roeselum]|nr:hypothetical protein EQH57_0333 [Dictyocoela roeselum]
MARLSKLKVEGKYTKIEQDGLASLIGEVLKQVADRKRMRIDDLKFVVNSHVDISRNLTINELASIGFPILDYIIFRQLTEKGEKVDVIVDEKVKSYSVDDAMKCLFYYYFMMMTRVKVVLNPDEKIPNFITGYLKLNISYYQIMKILSVNDIENFSHVWIKEIDVNELGESVKKSKMG